MKTALKAIAYAITAGLVIVTFTGCTGPQLAQSNGGFQATAGFQIPLGGPHPVSSKSSQASANDIGILNDGEPEGRMIREERAWYQSTMAKTILGLGVAFAATEATGITDFTDGIFDSEDKKQEPKPRVNTFRATNGGKINVVGADQKAYNYHTIEASGSGSEITLDFDSGDAIFAE